MQMRSEINSDLCSTRRIVNAGSDYGLNNCDICLFIRFDYYERRVRLHYRLLFCGWIVRHLRVLLFSKCIFRKSYHYRITWKIV